MFYAGFWKRVAAFLLDGLVIMPIYVLLMWFQTFSHSLAMILIVPASLLFVIYRILFHARSGQTIGKRILKIRVVTDSGEKIGWRDSILRSSPYAAFLVFSVIFQLLAYYHLSPTEFAALPLLEKLSAHAQYLSFWSILLGILYNLFFWVEVVFVAAHKKKKAVHDFIAKTVVQDFNPASQTASGEPKKGDATGGIIPYLNPPALISYYLGVFSLIPFFGLVLGLPAVILGVKGLKKRKREPEVRGAVHAWIGILFGGLNFLLYASFFLIALLAFRRFSG